MYVMKVVLPPTRKEDNADVTELISFVMKLSTEGLSRVSVTGYWHEMFQGDGLRRSIVLKRRG